MLTSSLESNVLICASDEICTNKTMGVDLFLNGTRITTSHIRLSNSFRFRHKSMICQYSNSYKKIILCVSIVLFIVDTRSKGQEKEKSSRAVALFS